MKTTNQPNVPPSKWKLNNLYENDQYIYAFISFCSTTNKVTGTTYDKLEKVSHNWDVEKDGMGDENSSIKSVFKGTVTEFPEYFL